MLEAETGESVISVFSINLERSKFGASLFSEGDVYIMPTDSTGIHRDMIEKLLIQKNEIKILSSTRSNISQLKSCLPSEVSIQLLPASSFFCCNAAEIQDRYGIVMPLDLSEDNESSFKSLNALLSYISNSQPNIELANIKVLLMQVDSCDVAISKSSLQALQIFDFEPHPSMHASNYDFKEGCSIFSIFNQVASEEGREKLRNWFQNPTRNQQILKERQESIGVLLQSEMSFFKDSAVKALKKCIRFKNILNDLKFRPSANDLLRIGRFCESFHEISVLLQDSKIIPFPLVALSNSINFTPIFDLSHTIRRVIDSSSYKDSEIYTIRDHVNPDLDSLRRKYTNLPDFLTGVVAEIAQGIHSSSVEAVNIVYFPQLGFLITLPMLASDGSDSGRLGEAMGFQLQFQSDKVSYFKNDKMRDLDESIGDVYADIMDVQLEIMQQVVNMAVSCESLLKDALDICSELDCLISMSKVAQMYSLTCPELVDDPAQLQIEDGRHLLVERYSDNACISNDCMISGQPTKMIITGPNSSGKSVYLKKVGIITFLAHIGSFVPAKSARIGLVDRILTRIKTCESSQKAESCFMIDLKQIKSICETATEKSLILIDEFGKGTCHDDGMALFSGFLAYFSKRPARLLAITHMYEIFRNELVPEVSESFKFAHMKVYKSESGLCYLYRLEEGRGEEQSFAIDCARESGIPESVLQKATEIYKNLLNGASPEDLQLLATNEDLVKVAIQYIQKV